MATSLINTTPADTYVSLLKLGDNSALTSTLKVVSDGAGNDTPISVSTTAVRFGTSTGLNWDNTNGRLGIGTNVPDRKLTIETADSNVLKLKDNTTNFIDIAVSNRPQIEWKGSSGSLYLSGRGDGLFIGSASSDAIARLQVKGSGTTSATTALRVENSAAVLALSVRDDGQVQLGQSTNFTVSGATTFNRYELVVGALSSVPSAILSATSTTRGFLPPRMTTTEKNAISSPAAGLVVYDTTTNKLCCYDGSTWNDLF
jgi:hypothetical protein